MGTDPRIGRKLIYDYAALVALRVAWSNIAPRATTGEPKGAMLTHANFCAVLNIFNYWDRNNVSQEMEKALAVLPLFHIFGLSFIMLLAVANRASGSAH